MFIKQIICIYILHLWLGGLAIAKEGQPETNGVVTKGATTVYLNSTERRYIVKMGDKEIKLPVFPVLTIDDGIDAADLGIAQQQLMEEYLQLTPLELERFYINRRVFLADAANLLHQWRLIFHGVNRAAKGVKATKNIALQTWKKTKGLTKQAWQKAQEVSAVSEEISQETLSIEDPELNKEAVPSENLESEHDSIEEILQELNILLLKKARTVVNTVEFGLTLGAGVSANLGLKRPQEDLTLGAVTDVLFHLGRLKSTGAYILTIQSLLEKMDQSLTKMAASGGVDIKVGFYFKDDQDLAFVKGSSNYPAMTVTGFSNYGDRLIYYLFATEMFVPFPNDLSGINTTGVAATLFKVELINKFPYFKNIQGNSLIGQLFRLIPLLDVFENRDLKNLRAPHKKLISEIASHNQMPETSRGEYFNPHSGEPSAESISRSCAASITKE